jgi:hypothetical protein
MRKALDDKFPNVWLGRADRSSGLPEAQIVSRRTFFLCGYVKNIVYGDKMRDLRHLRNRITAAITTVTPDMAAP